MSGSGGASLTPTRGPIVGAGLNGRDISQARRSAVVDCSILRHGSSSSFCNPRRALSLSTGIPLTVLSLAPARRHLVYAVVEPPCITADWQEAGSNALC